MNGQPMEIEEAKRTHPQVQQTQGPSPTDAIEKALQSVHSSGYDNRHSSMLLSHTPKTGKNDDDDDDDDEERYSSRSNQGMSSRVTAVRYVLLTVAMVALTCVCPNTRLRNRTDGIHWLRLTELLIVLILTLASFFILHQSDPGYITAEMMDDGWEEVEKDSSTRRTRATAQAASAIQDLETGTTARQRQTSKDRDDDNDDDENVDSDSNEMDPLAALTTTGASTRRPLCDMCGFCPPLRSHHCKQCDRHVAMFDHHCGFIGTCIGERNHCRFWWFLTFQMIGLWCIVKTIGSAKAGLMTLFGSSLRHRHDHSHATPVMILEALFVMSAKLVVYPTAIAACLVWVIHSFMAATNSTTFEFTKESRHLEYLRGTTMTDLPYSYNRLDQNLYLFCCQRDDAWHPWFGKKKKNKNGNDKTDHDWRPTIWLPPSKIVRDSENWWEHPWQNKYWSCC